MGSSVYDLSLQQISTLIALEDSSVSVPAMVGFFFGFLYNSG